jgi:hypothetical protein
MAETDPVALFETLTNELSASGDAPLTASTDTVKQPNLTARQAWQAILWKTNAAVDMRGTAGPSERPFKPSVPDDLLGQVLSMRAEVLQTQALLSALITALVQAKVIPQLDQVGILASIQEQL